MCWLHELIDKLVVFLALAHLSTLGAVGVALVASEPARAQTVFYHYTLPVLAALLFVAAIGFAARCVDRFVERGERA